MSRQNHGSGHTYKSPKKVSVWHAQPGHRSDVQEIPSASNPFVIEVTEVEQPLEEQSMGNMFPQSQGSTRVSCFYPVFIPPQL